MTDKYILNSFKKLHPLDILKWQKYSRGHHVCKKSRQTYTLYLLAAVFYRQKIFANIHLTKACLFQNFSCVFSERYHSWSGIWCHYFSRFCPLSQILQLRHCLLSFIRVVNKCIYKTKYFKNTMRVLGLKQIIHFKTNNKNTLGLFLTNNRKIR